MMCSVYSLASDSLGVRVYSLRNPVMPVADGLQLRERNGHLPPLPTDLYKHVMLAGIFSGHAQDLGGFSFPERRDGVCGDTPRPERETDFAFQIVIPAHCLFIRTGIDDSFVVDAVFPHRISLGPSHDFAPRMRRTDVRPICRCRAISDLLMPARYSFRISAACRAAVSGRPRRLPFCRACAKPARV